MYTLEQIKLFEKDFGNPIYLFKEKEFIDNFKYFKSCFERHYRKYIPAYSYKTNYTPAICRLVKTLGGYAEVVSDMEYSVARSIGFDFDKIIYNGPVKGPLADELLLGGGIVNVDSLDELKRVVAIAVANQDKFLSIGLRVNINIGQSFVSRFGIDADSDDLGAAFQTVNSIPNLRVAGLHCHIGQSRSLKAWSNRVVRMLQLADTYFADAPDFIDLGSGMFARMEDSLASQFGNDIPSFEEYAAAVAVPFAEHYGNLPLERQPILFTEPGTTVINSYVDFLARVESIKHIKGKEFVTLNCSKDNIGDICKLKQLPLDIVHDAGSAVDLSSASFVGYTCLEHDEMYSGFAGRLAVGDYVVFGNVGGYSNVSKPPFILWNCPMVAHFSDGSYGVIKRGESFDDVFSTYIF